MDEESYIVRIYRRSPIDSESDDSIVGVVEDIRHETRVAFRNIDELMQLFQSKTLRSQTEH